METIMLRPLVIGFVIFTVNAWGMESHDSGSESDNELAEQSKKIDQTSGLTFKYARDYFYEQKKLYLWSACEVAAVTGIAVGIGAFVLCIPGSVLTGIYCSNSTAYQLLNACQNQCNYNSCTIKCNSLYPLNPTLGDPVCQTGISFLSLYGLVVVSVICFWRIAKLSSQQF
jgi:hypothetical protein